MSKREYPDLPMVGVGGVLISDERVLLVRRGTDPGRGEWTIPGGLLEPGETLVEGVVRELQEETGLTVRVIELVEALERIFFDAEEAGPIDEAPAEAVEADVAAGTIRSATNINFSGVRDTTRPQPMHLLEGTRSDRPGMKPRYHYVILDYLCELVSGDPVISEEITGVVFVREPEMGGYGLTPAASRVIHKAFAIARQRGQV